MNGFNTLDHTAIRWRNQGGVAVVRVTEAEDCWIDEEGKAYSKITGSEFGRGGNHWIELRTISRALEA